MNSIMIRTIRKIIIKAYIVNPLISHKRVLWIKMCTTTAAIVKVNEKIINHLEFDLGKIANVKTQTIDTKIKSVSENLYY